MCCINKNNLFIVSFFLIFFALSYKAAASEANEYIAESYYKQYLKDFYYEQGKEFYYRGNLQEAILKFQSALKCDPEYKPAQLLLMLINEKIAQQYSLEEGKITSQKQKKEESAKKKSALNYYKEGISYFNKANYPEAINKFKESLKLIPGYEPALRYRVLSEEKLEQQIKAKEEKKIIQEQKEEARIKEQFADFHYQQGKDYFNQGKYDQAILKLKQALEFVPQYKPALNYIAMSQSRIEQQEKREREKQLIEKKKREEEERKQNLIASEKEAREKAAQKIKEEQARREKLIAAKKETVKKIAQEVKAKAVEKPVAQTPAVENAVPATVADQDITAQKRKQEMQARREKLIAAKKETVKKIAQEVKEKSAQKPVAQEPVVENTALVVAAAEGTTSQQQKQEEENKLAETKMKEKEEKEAKVQAAISAARERAAQKAQ